MAPAGSHSALARTGGPKRESQEARGLDLVLYQRERWGREGGAAFEEDGVEVVDDLLLSVAADGNESLLPEVHLGPRDDGNLHGLLLQLVHEPPQLPLDAAALASCGVVPKLHGAEVLGAVEGQIANIGMQGHNEHANSRWSTQHADAWRRLQVNGFLSQGYAMYVYMSPNMSAIDTCDE